MTKLCYFCEAEHNNNHSCCANCWNQLLKENDRRYKFNRRK